MLNLIMSFSGFDEQKRPYFGLGNAAQQGEVRFFLADARRDPDLAILHGDPQFELMYPEKDMAGSNLHNP